MPSIYTMMKLLVAFANRNLDVKSFISGLETKVVVDVKEESPFYLELAKDKIFVHKGKPERFDAMIKSDKQTFKEVISGKLSQEDAFNRKMIETSGSIADAMRLRYIMNQTLQKSKMLSFTRKLLSIFQ